MIVAIIPFDTTKPVLLVGAIPHLEFMQTVVGGYVEKVDVMGGCLWVNEDAKQKGLPVNPVASLVMNRESDNLRGQVLLTGPVEDGQATTLNGLVMGILHNSMEGVFRIRQEAIASYAAERLKISIQPNPADLAPNEPQEGDIVVEKAPDGGFMLTPLDRKVYTWPEVWQAVTDETSNSGKYPNVWLVENGQFDIVSPGFDG